MLVESSADSLASSERPISNWYGNHWVRLNQQLSPFQIPGSTSTGTIDGFESITTSGFLSASINGFLHAGRLTYSSQSGYAQSLTDHTDQWRNAQHYFIGCVRLWRNAQWIGKHARSIQCRVGSLILASGNLAIGSSISTTGFNSRGDLIIDQHTVSLLDASEAVLGSLTTLAMEQLLARSARAMVLLVDFGNNVSGFGTINSPNLSSKPFTNNGAITGASSVNPITLTGYIKVWAT